MKIEKNKIVFASVILCVILFIGSYAVMIVGDEEEPIIENNQIPIPELEGQQKEYGSKLEALDDLKEEREITAPSPYPDHMLDDKGYFNPDYMEYEKHRIIDSIYQNNQISYSERRYEHIGSEDKQLIKIEKAVTDTIGEIKDKNPLISAKEMALEHHLFFASNPFENESLITQNTDVFIYVRVDGTQTVRNDYRLQMRLNKDALINNVSFPKNTPIYGFVSFKPNRTLLEIESINHQPIKLRAFDLQDGSEGIYIENSFRAEAREEVVGDIVDDINIVGVPQISGIKRIFQRDNRTVKVTVTDNYQLILKSIL